MKKILLILFAIPVYCFSQQNNNIPKPATDACPSWNNKINNSKAEYFYFLRTNKAKDQQVASTPSSSKRTNPTQKIVRYAPGEDPFLTPKRARRTAQTTIMANNTGYPGIINNVRETALAELQKEVETIKPKEEPVTPIAIQKEEAVVTPVEKDTATKKETAAPDEKPLSKEKLKKERRSRKRSVRSSTPKVKSCKSGNASKCPSF